jgi:hypothetical protein
MHGSLIQSALVVFITLGICFSNMYLLCSYLCFFASDVYILNWFLHLCWLVQIKCVVCTRKHLSITFDLTHLTAHSYTDISDERSSIVYGFPSHLWCFCIKILMLLSLPAAVPSVVRVACPCGGGCIVYAQNCNPNI